MSGSLLLIAALLIPTLPLAGQASCATQRYALMNEADTLGWEDVTQRTTAGVRRITSSSFRIEAPDTAFATYDFSLRAGNGALIHWESHNVTSPIYHLTWRPEAKGTRLVIEWPGNDRPNVDSLLPTASQPILLGELWLRMEEMRLAPSAQGSFATVDTRTGGIITREWRVTGREPFPVGTAMVEALRVVVTGGGETLTGIVAAAAPHRLLQLTSDKSPVRRVISVTCM
jgi:hypothetical protein